MTTLLTLIALALAPLLPACEFEDSTNCTWSATVQGNGIGASYVDIAGTAYYIGDWTVFTVVLMLIGSVVAASFARLSAYCFYRARLARNPYRSER